jgi:alkyldihydroxyacetonephosphate synthase
MTTHATLSRRAPRRFWGWGQLDATLDTREQATVKTMVEQLDVPYAERPVPQVHEFTLPAPRVMPPPVLAASFSDKPLDRLNHCVGKSYADLARMWLRSAPTPPDWVAYPADEQAVVDILDWAQTHNVAVIPYGGGSSVCGGVEAAVGDSYAGVISLDLERLNRVLEVDTVSRAARIQAGALGPELQAQLKPHGLTLRHFPQSFEFSTLGGWIVTRAGGHYATQTTHIDDLVESTRLVTPAGVLQTRRLPGSGAGPAPDRLVLGSEGTLGVLTEAWVRVQQPPLFRASASIRFTDYFAAARCVRALAQSGLNPANCRLLDPLETVFSGVGDGRFAILVLGFESADHPLRAWMERALELVRDHGGIYDASQGSPAPSRTARPPPAASGSCPQEGHAEDQPGDGQHDQNLHAPDGEIGQDLAQHHLGRGDGHGSRFSIVPRSISRVRAMPVIITMVICRMTPRRPGTMLYCVMPSGL